MFIALITIRQHIANMIDDGKDGLGNIDSKGLYATSCTVSHPYSLHKISNLDMSCDVCGRFALLE